MEDYALDNFCRTHCAHHFEKTCPEFLNSFYALLLPPGTPKKENKEVEEENYEDEEREAEELKKAQHPPSLILDQDETELDNMDFDAMKEDCMEIDYNLLSKRRSFYFKFYYNSFHAYRNICQGIPQKG